MSPQFTATADHALTITTASRDQAGLLAVLIRQSYADVARRFGLTPQNAPTHPSACTADWIAADLREGMPYFTAVSGNMSVGCVALKKATPDVYYLMRLGVLPLFRKQGIGHRLTRQACRQARRAGAKEVSVGLIAAQEELAAWYRRQGFENVERRCFSHLPFEVLLMRHVLDLAEDN